jgi:acetyl-CoA acetyltransferase
VSVNRPGNQLGGKAAIVGIGATEFSKASGRSEMSLACESVAAAITDAGLQPSDIDGMVTYSTDNNPDIEIARHVGIGELRHFSRVHYGGGAAAGTVVMAAMAVATGVADAVVCYRAFNERSGRRFGAGVQDIPNEATAERAQFSWTSPFGQLTPASWVAMVAQRYMHEYGATSEDFGRIAVADRKHAATNPAAWFYEQPITLDDHQASRWIVEPLHLLDCCQESDGGQALVIVSAERARDLAHPPAIVTAAAQGAGAEQWTMTSFYRDDIAHLPEMGVVAQELWTSSGLSPSDIQTAVLYDHFTPYVLMQLEEFGFCGRGEAKDFIKDGAIEMGGALPLNTHGGQLGEAYIHGMNGIAEGVRQVRGTSVNQVDDVEHVLVTAGTGVPTSGLILGVDR